MPLRRRRPPPVSPICDVCGERPPTRRLERLSDHLLWTEDFCDECYARELGPVGEEDPLKLQGLARSPDTTAYTREAAELALRAEVHGQTLSVETLTEASPPRRPA